MLAIIGLAGHSPHLRFPLSSNAILTMAIRRALVALLLLPSLCLAQAGSFGRWTYLSTVELEAKNPGAGVAYRFQAGLANADVFFYDAGKVWPDGTDSKQFEEMVVQVGKELRMAEQAGIFAELEIGTSSTVTIVGRNFQLQRLKFRKGVIQVTSLMYLSGIKGKLIKVRVTAPDGAAAILEEDAASLIESVFKRQTVFEAPWLQPTSPPAVQ